MRISDCSSDVCSSDLLFVAHGQESSADDVFWFGGGLDLTPYYPFEDDAQHFHQVCHDAVAPFGADKYPTYKAWCDDYFMLRHRDETRGVGGLFFDDLNAPDFETSFALTRAVGECFLPRSEEHTSELQSLMRIS